MYLKIWSGLQLFFSEWLFQSVMISWHLVKLWHFLLEHVEPSFVQVHFNSPEHDSQRVTFASDVTSDFQARKYQDGTWSLSGATGCKCFHGRELWNALLLFGFSVTLSSNRADAIKQKQKCLLILVSSMHPDDFCGHTHVKLLHPSCQKTGLRPPVFDCLLGHFHKAFLSDSGKLPSDYLGRTNGNCKLQNLFASYEES